jgi:hypothetical protein
LRAQGFRRGFLRHFESKEIEFPYWRCWRALQRRSLFDVLLDLSSGPGRLLVNVNYIQVKVLGVKEIGSVLLEHGLVYSESEIAVIGKSSSSAINLQAELDFVYYARYGRRGVGTEKTEDVFRVRPCRQPPDDAFDIQGGDHRHALPCPACG